MRNPSQNLLFLLLIGAILGGCTRSGGGQENLNAVLWVQTSAEYIATTTGIYAAATTVLQQGIGDGAPGQMVVVMDLDETIFNNSRYKAHELMARSHDELTTWDQWTAFRNATAVPGAVEFIKASRELGVNVRIVTNRRCMERPGVQGSCPQEEDALVNLRQIGVEIDGHALLMRGESPPERCLELLSAAENETGRWSTPNKVSRRECIAHDYDILMTVGDQLSDFVGDSGNSTLASRDAARREHQDKWGISWIMIPNPTYGTWFRLLYPDREAHLQGS